jgi:hypothetical protein
MKPKFYIHIGLPKTATSTLQRQFFPQFDRLDDWYYAGIRIPRSASGEFYNAYMECLHTGDFDAYQIAVGNIANASKILLSEEVTLVNYNGTWDTKLDRLRKMLEPYDYNILLTIRHPVDAIFSYYVERFEIFKGHYPQFDMSLVQDPEMAVYRYSTFIPFLEKLFGRERIKYADFNSIIRNDLKALYDFMDISSGGHLKLKKWNSKTKTKKAISVEGERYYLRMTHFIRDRLGMNLNSFIFSLPRRLMPRWAKNYRPKYTVPILSAEQRALMETELRDDILKYQQIVSSI